VDLETGQRQSERQEKGNFLTSAIALPICTNLSTSPMTVLKLSDELALEIMSMTVPAASIPDGADNRSSFCTNDSSWSRSRTGLAVVTLEEGMDVEITGVGCSGLHAGRLDPSGIVAQEITTLAPLRSEDDPGDKSSQQYSVGAYCPKSFFKESIHEYVPFPCNAS
jgi:hypothetical protein